MTTYEDVPAMIDFACERCGRAYVPPVGARQAGAGKPQDEAKRRRLSREEDQAYQLFCQSMHICPKCRQCVCHECWAASRKVCRLCAGEVPGIAARPGPVSGPSAGVAPAIAPILAPVLAPAAVPAPSRMAAPTAAPALPYDRFGDRTPSGSNRMAAPSEPLRYLGAKRPVIASATPPKQGSVFGSARVRAAVACVVILILIGAGVGLAGLASGTPDSAGVVGVTATPSRSAGDVGNPSGTADLRLDPSGGTRAESPSARGAGNSGSKTPGPTLAPGATPTPTPRVTAAATAGATATATATPSPTDAPTPAPTAPAKPTISCTTSPSAGGYTVTCIADPNGPIAGDVQHWFWDDHDKGNAPTWEFGDSVPHTVYLVIERATLPSLPSNTVSGSDTIVWS